MLRREVTFFRSKTIDCIFKAYITNPSILILDEATSSIDSYTEELIQNAIQKITLGKTSMIIAHRLATIEKADKIIVLDNGRIVEFGNHSNLLSKRGIYKDLYDSQLKREKNKIKERVFFNLAFEFFERKYLHQIHHLLCKLFYHVVQK